MKYHLVQQMLILLSKSDGLWGGEGVQPRLDPCVKTMRVYLFYIVKTMLL